MGSSTSAPNTLQLFLPILGLIVAPVGLYVLMIPITYYRRRRQLQANPQIRFDMGTVMSASTVEHNTWENFKRQNSGYVLETRDRLRVSSFDAARRYFFSPPAKAQDKDMEYLMQIYVVHGQTAYFITVWSKTKPIFEENRPSIDAILNSLVLKTEAGPSALGGTLVMMSAGVN